MPIENIATVYGSVKQVRHGLAIGYGSTIGLKGVVLARKMCSTVAEDDPKIAEILLSLSVAHDKFLQSSNIRPDLLKCISALISPKLVPARPGAAILHML